MVAQSRDCAIETEEPRLVEPRCIGSVGQRIDDVRGKFV